MFFKKGNLVALAGCLLVLSILAAGCTGQQATTENEPKGAVSIGYVTWDSEIASTNVLKQVFEKAGYDVEIVAVDAGPLYQAVAKGDVDCTVSAWLPATQANYWETYGDDIVFVRKNLEGAKIGLVVPTYVTIDSIDELNSVKDKFNGKITGIEPGAGIMQNTEEAITEYGLNYELVSSSSAGMAAELRSAVQDEKWIVVTGWTPHWKFARWDLKYLDDPKGVYGGEEYIATLARQGLQEDQPGVYDILTRFSWTAADMESVMLSIENGASEEDAAEEWVNAHPDQVNAWIGTE
ncbi:glycine betaine ABC transporter substrate-binding protein [Methanoculleus sp. FWC-SCC1]|uniref:Glycine betaine ABC transporter substrate-binding protein n=1 Tax=Methanoculleus frigidifontis TaxID=2584085 RepID=A0ABT8M6A7_9EURY|nr:glycine betaine ABC transporter substrate-binding protein [Methanoculleus sp. FWC-SCC1]MDN7023471.1 glycine betaine ABC transporter substrate-binding protein [Methanoculleus sp. FWC-SCC1]